MRHFGGVLAVVLLGACLATAFAQKPSKADANTRSVEGVVTNQDDSPAPGVVVQLENTKTQQIRSYITQDDGKYRFYELSTEVDYRLKAERRKDGMVSSTKTLSSFDSRKKAIVNLKLGPR